jgi:multicomponent K+:H+ antiporter subunit E
MRRLLPAPLVSAALFALWLLLDAPPGAAQVLQAALVAIAVPIVVAPLRPQSFRVRRPLRVLGFMMSALRGALVSNLQVALAMVGPRAALPEGRFVRVPLELTDPGALAALAVVTTLVPGTVWCELAADRSAVLLHVLAVGDVDAFIADYKARYERPLKEIFE